jgi:hypothetical protein
MLLSLTMILFLLLTANILISGRPYEQIDCKIYPADEVPEDPRAFVSLFHTLRAPLKLQRTLTYPWS